MKPVYQPVNLAAAAALVELSVPRVLGIIGTKYADPTRAFPEPKIDTMRGSKRLRLWETDDVIDWAIRTGRWVECEDGSFEPANRLTPR